MLLLSLFLAATAAAESAPVSVFTSSKQYSYLGCYNETTDLEVAKYARALAGGVVDVRPKEMTVPACLNFCASSNGSYRFAGLEWSRECWCAQSLSGFAAKLDDGQCNFPCEGNTSLACGGALKLSVYKLSTSAEGPVGAAGLLLVPWGLLLSAFVMLETGL